MKKSNWHNKGYLLLESIYSFSLVIIAISFYLPILMNFSQKNMQNKVDSQIKRVIYEQVLNRETFQPNKEYLLEISGQRYTYVLTETEGIVGVQLKEKSEHTIRTIKFEEK